MNRYDLQIFLIDFPGKGNEAVTKNEDNSYTIFLNARLSYEKQLEAYAHAIRHIKNGDVDKEDVDRIEFQSHNFKNT